MEFSKYHKVDTEHVEHLKAKMMAQRPKNMANMYEVIVRSVNRICRIYLNHQGPSQKQSAPPVSHWAGHNKQRVIQVNI